MHPQKIIQKTFVPHYNFIKKNEEIYLAHEEEEFYANVKIKLSIYE